MNSNFQLEDKFNELEFLNQIRTRLAKEFDSCSELDLYTAAIYLINARIREVINDVKIKNEYVEGNGTTDEAVTFF